MRSSMVLRTAFVAVLMLAAAACAVDREPDDENLSQPPTTFEGQPESLTTVPDDDAPAPTAPTTTFELAAPTGVTAAELCANAERVEPPPEIDTELLPETSGVAYSRTEPDRLYAHNDSGNLPRLFGIGPDSTIESAWTIGAALLDWEDLAVAGPYVYAADTGDNLHIRTTVRVHRVPEPTGTEATLEPAAVWIFGYEDFRYDAEALLVEPDGSEAVIVTKGLDAPSRVFVLPLDEPAAEPPTLRPVAELALERGLITAGDVSADGRVIGLRTIEHVLLWDRIPGESIADTLTGPFCDAPAAPERQGEALAFHPDGRGYTTLSERASATRNDFRLP